MVVVDILSEGGFGQRDYVFELGTERLVDEIENAVRGLLPGETRDVSWELGDGSNRKGSVTLKELHEKVLPPLDDEVAKSVSEYDTLDALRGDIEDRLRERLEEETDAQFRQAAVDELVKASNVDPEGLSVEMRTRELLQGFIRTLQQRGLDPNTYLQMTNTSGAELEARLRGEAKQSIARELLLEAVADELGLEVTDDEIREELRRQGEVDENHFPLYHVKPQIDKQRWEKQTRDERPLHYLPCYLPVSAHVCAPSPAASACTRLSSMSK